MSLPQEAQSSSAAAFAERSVEGGAIYRSMTFQFIGKRLATRYLRHNLHLDPRVGHCATNALSPLSWRAYP